MTTNFFGQEQWARRGELLIPHRAVTAEMLADGAVTGRALGSGFGTAVATLTDLAITSASTWTNWGSAVSIANPKVGVSFSAMLSGYIYDFTAVRFQQVRLGISVDGGSSFTYGPAVGTAVGQSATFNNRGGINAAHNRTGTPTGGIVLQAQAWSDGTTSVAAAGSILYVTSPT